MRRRKAASFFCQWKKPLGWEQGSRVVVVLENRWEWDNLPQRFRESFIWYYDVLFLEIDHHGFCFEQDYGEEALKKLQERRPGAMAAVGSFPLLQTACLLRDRLDSGTIPVLLFSDGDRWQAFFRDTLWIRESDGRTQYWGYMGRHEKDMLVLTEQGELWAHLPDAFEKEVCRLRSLLQKIYAARTGEDIVSGKCDTGRDLCEELAEPLRVVYGIPMLIGIYFSLLYLYRLLSASERELLCKLPGTVSSHADWRLEKLAQRYCREEVSSVLLPERDIPLLTQMAMEGIENYPPEQQPGWEQVEAFYRELCQI